MNNFIAVDTDAGPGIIFIDKISAIIPNETGCTLFQLGVDCPLELSDTVRDLMVRIQMAKCEGEEQWSLMNIQMLFGFKNDYRR